MKKGDELHLKYNEGFGDGYRAREREESKNKLTQKEAFLLWSIICWFYKPITSQLKYKLYFLINKKSHLDLHEKYDQAIYTRMVEIGKYLTQKGLVKEG